MLVMASVSRDTVVGQRCSGTQVVEPGSGVVAIYDDAANNMNYASNAVCAWKISCPAGTYAKLYLDAIATELGLDRVRWYLSESGAAFDPNGCVNGRFSGVGTQTSSTTMTTDTAWMTFTSDGSRVGAGFAVRAACSTSGSPYSSFTCVEGTMPASMVEPTSSGSSSGGSSSASNTGAPPTIVAASVRSAPCHR
jgi:hypothetical protein